MGLLAAMALVAALGAPAYAASAARADSRPPGGDISDPVVRNVDIAGPAIVRILTIYTASVEFDLCGNLVSLPPGGGAYTIAFSGSGAFISANGDILTAGHVVDNSKGWLEQGAFEELAPDIAQLLDNNLACLHLSTPLTPDDIANGAVQSLGIPYQMTTTQPVYHIFQSTTYTGPLSVASVSRLRDILTEVPHPEAKVLAFSDILKDDLAVIHVDLTDTPSIALDDSGQVAPQDKLTVIGYPGNGDLDPELGGDIPTNFFTPSVNTVTVSAVKQNANGSQLLQVGGNVENGDSGGPALDAAGHVVGVVSFSELASTPEGTSFFRSSNSAQPLIQEAGVSVKPGAFEVAWQQAFSDYSATYAGHWHKAQTELDALASKYPAFAGVQPYKAYADNAAAHESLSASSQAPDPLLIGGIAAGVIGLLIVLGIVLLLTRRRPKNPGGGVPANVPSGYNPSSYPSYPGAPPGQGPNSGPHQGQYQSGVPTPAQLQRTGPMRDYSGSHPTR